MLLRIELAFLRKIWSDIVDYRLLKDTENSGDTHAMLPDDWMDWESDKKLGNDRCREDLCDAG
jgi:hypothetical protein